MVTEVEVKVKVKVKVKLKLDNMKKDFVKRNAEHKENLLTV
jgi:hypothetical protein